MRQHRDCLLLRPLLTGRHSVPPSAGSAAPPGCHIVPAAGGHRRGNRQQRDETRHQLGCGGGGAGRTPAPRRVAHFLPASRPVSGDAGGRPRSAAGSDGGDRVVPPIRADSCENWVVGQAGWAD